MQKSSELQELSIEEAMLRDIEENPNSSTKEITRREGINNISVWRILKKNDLHSYNQQKVQELIPADYVQRSLFCSEIQRKYNENTTFIKHILFTDEVTFTRGGIFNTHNTHIWVIENSHSIIHQNFQKQFSVNV